MMILLVFILDSLICCLPLINQYCFPAITGITTIGYQISYAIPILLRLTHSKKVFKQSTFSLGWLSQPLGWIASIWLIATSCFFIFPTSFDENMQQSATTFNYTCAVVGGVIVFALTYWFLPVIGARHFFEGPRRPDSIRKGNADQQIDTAQ